MLFFFFILKKGGDGRGGLVWRAMGAGLCKSPSDENGLRAAAGAPLLPPNGGGRVHPEVDGADGMPPAAPTANAGEDGRREGGVAAPCSPPAGAGLVAVDEDGESGGRAALNVCIGPVAVPLADGGAVEPVHTLSAADTSGVSVSTTVGPSLTEQQDQSASSHPADSESAPGLEATLEQPGGEAGEPGTGSSPSKWDDWDDDGDSGAEDGDGTVNGTDTEGMPKGGGSLPAVTSAANVSVIAFDGSSGAQPAADASESLRRASLGNVELSGLPRMKVGPHSSFALHKVRP